MASTQAVVGGGGGGASPPKLTGSFPTPPELVDRVIEAVMPPITPGQDVSVLDPACGDGRFLVAAADHIARHGGRPVVHGVDIDHVAVGAATLAVAARRRRGPAMKATIEEGDALARDWGATVFDVVVGNPPFLSQMASATTRGRSSTRGGGPYADAAAEFLDLAVERARPDGGRVGLVLPQSILGSRDVQHIRDAVDRRAAIVWSWWSPRKYFDAEVLVCALGFRRHPDGHDGNSGASPDDRAPIWRDTVWSDVIVRSLGVPPLPAVDASGAACDRVTFTANFRDEYYGMVPGVDDHERGPLLITSGLIDPNRCWWGQRPVTFNRRTFARPRIDVTALSERMQTWAARLSVPKVLIANQTRVIECVVDGDGSMLPGVPVVTGRLRGADALALDALAAVLSAPYASAWAWRRAAGTGLSARTVRVGPRLLADLPWPAGSLDAAVDAWRHGDLTTSGQRVHVAYGISDDDALVSWWRSLRP